MSALDPQGRVIMVSGANCGIGRAIAEHLWGVGYKLSLGARRPESIAHWRARGALVAPFEAREPTSAARWVADTAAHFGRIDGLVNNAGIVRRFAFDRPDEAALDEMWDVNLKAPTG